jgi:hypothetical protein
VVEVPRLCSRCPPPLPLLVSPTPTGFAVLLATGLCGLALIPATVPPSTGLSVRFGLLKPPLSSGLALVCAPYLWTELPLLVTLSPLASLSSTGFAVPSGLAEPSGLTDPSTPAEPVTC